MKYTKLINKIVLSSVWVVAGLKPLFRVIFSPFSVVDLGRVRRGFPLKVRGLGRWWEVRRVVRCVWL